MKHLLYLGLNLPPQIRPLPLPLPHYLLESLADRVLLFFTQCLHSSCHKPDAPFACDRVLGDDAIGALGHGSALHVQQIVPQGLSLFKLALIADVAHREHLIYSLFKNQCY